MNRYTTVDAYVAAQTDGARAQVNALRRLVLDANPRLVEIIKWNSPNFVLDGEDRLTVSVDGKGAVRLILHLGTAVTEDKAADSAFVGDPHGLLKWHSNIRASLAMPDVATDERRAVEVIRAWLAVTPAV